METQTVSLLVVDDDEVDRELIVRGLRKAKIANPVITAVDGVEGLEVLRGTETTPGLDYPYIVILDWNMPRMNGAEFLEELRNDDRLKDAVVFVLTTSGSDSDIAAAYTKSVSGYIVKDRVGPDFIRLVELLDAYWRVVELPRRRG